MTAGPQGGRSVLRAIAYQLVNKFNELLGWNWARALERRNLAA